MMQVTLGVTSVVYLATNRSDLYVAHWSRRTLRSVTDWSAHTTNGRSSGAWTTQREPGVLACD